MFAVFEKLKFVNFSAGGAVPSAELLDFALAA